VADQTQAEAAVMEATAKKFETVNSDLTSMLSTLMSELSMLTSAWQGQGARAFDQVKERYAEDLRKLNQALSETAISIRDSGAGYTTTDTDAASRVGNAGGGGMNLPL
jgi:WXG100 family type VII secretion target